MFSTVVAYTYNYGISQDGKIPWQCHADMAHFKKLTMGNVVIMGRKTFESIGKVLPGRINIIISRTMISNDMQVVEQAIESHEPVGPNVTKSTNIVEKFGRASKAMVSNVLDTVSAANSSFEQKQATVADLPFLVFNDPWKCVEYCCKTYKNKKLFVIGGSEIYKWFLDNGLVYEEYCTKIAGFYNCDRFYPMDNRICKLANIINMQPEKTSTPACEIIKYTVENTEENKFLDLAKKILDKGNKRIDRTSVGTLSLFGEQLSFDLTNNTFPLLTSRKMSFKWIFEELMLYIRGQTDSKILEQKGINIWTGNTSRAFLDSRGLQRLPVGDMGASYGFLFRHFGAEYTTCNDNYDGVGIDQLSAVIAQLKHNPSDRRIIISLWDPTNLDDCPLPPCLYNYQFYVREETSETNTQETNIKPVRYLSCMMTQRSSDFAVAGGWNVATGALLTYMLAAVCDMKPERLIWNIGDVHIYNNLIGAMKEQIGKNPYPFPKLFIGKRDNIEQYEYTDLKLIGYKSHDTIRVVMNV